MLFTFLPLALLALLDGCAAAVPAPTHARLGTRQTIEDIVNGMNTTTNHATLLGVNLSKDKQCVGLSLVLSASRSFKHRSYYTIVSLGNMSFRVALDTGSSDFWLVSSACSSSVCSSLPRYQLAYGSTTFESVNKNDTLFNVSYADSTCKCSSLSRVPSLYALLRYLRLAPPEITLQKCPLPLLRESKWMFARLPLGFLRCPTGHVYRASRGRIAGRVKPSLSQKRLGSAWSTTWHVRLSYRRRP